MKKIYIAALLAGTALAPAAYAQEAAPTAEPQAAGESCEQLVAFVRDADQEVVGFTNEQATELSEAGDQVACQDALATAQAAAETGTAGQAAPEGAAPEGAAPAEGAAAEGAPAEGEEGFEADVEADVQIDVPEPAVTVDQPDAQVTVEQAQPQVRVNPGRPIVTVNQAQPQVTVQVPPPRITIDIPRPEILVEMPNPDVAVSLPEPRVTVNQPEPTVNVEQGEAQIEVGSEPVAAGEAEQPQVQVQEGQAAVQLTQPESAEVTIEQAQPQVRYNAAEPNVTVEATGEPEVTFNQSGEAQVQIRQMSVEETQQAAQQQGQEAQGQQQPAASATDAAAEPAAAPAAAQATTAAEFVPMAAMGNMFEIQSSEIALEKSQNAELQQFAQQMVADHTQAGEDMAAAVEAGQVEAEMPAELDAEHQEKIEQLQNASAEEFDALYHQMQVEAHEKAVGLFQGYSENGEEGPVREFATATLPALQSHLEMITAMSPAQ